MPTTGTPVQGCTHKIPHTHGEPRTEKSKCCTCDKCVAARRAYDRARRNKQMGWDEKVPAHITRAHIDTLIDAGGNVLWIARQAGVEQGTIHRIKSGKARLVSRAVHDLIMGVEPHAVHPEGLVDATASVRRLRHLSLTGWTGQYIGELSGLHRRHIERIRDGDFETVRQETADAIEGVTRMLLKRPAPTDRNSKGVATRSRKKGWVSMFAYDNIHDPTEEPNVTPLVAPSKYATPVEDKLDELEYLIDAGTPLGDALRRVGYASFDSVEKVARRARPTLVARMQRLNRGEAA